MQSRERTAANTYGREWRTMKTQQLIELQNALEDMINNITTGDDIVDQLLQIQQLSAEIEETAPKMLMHYLQRKSYTKALDFLREL